MYSTRQKLTKYYSLPKAWLLDMTENHRIEYKRELTGNLEKEVVAFLNAREGGVLYIGMDDDGKAIGVQNCDQVQLIIKDRLKNNIQPSIMGLFEICTKNMTVKILSESPSRVAWKSPTS